MSKKPGSKSKGGGGGLKPQKPQKIWKGSISLPSVLRKALDKKLEGFPYRGNFSAYVTRLVELDLKKDELTGVAETLERGVAHNAGSSPAPREK